MDAATQICRNLSDLALVRAAYHHMRLLLDADLNSLRYREFHRVRESQRENQILALNFRAVSDADDIEIFLESVSDAVNRIRDQRARQTMQRAKLFRIALAQQNAVLQSRKVIPRGIGTVILPFGPCTSIGSALESESSLLRVPVSV